jgi:integrase
MRSHNPKNERIKHRYFIWLKEAHRQSDASVDAAAMAISRFELDTKYRDFAAFHVDQVRSFKHHLAEQQNQKTGQPLSKSTLHSTFSHLKRFFLWLADQPGYRSRIRYTDAEYFNLSEKDARIAKAVRPKNWPTLNQLNHTFSAMPADTEIDRRNRAMFAFTMLTGARDGAIASLKLKHIDLEEGSVFQDAAQVKTKFSKSFKTFFVPVDPQVRQAFEAWVTYLREDKQWGNEDPLFPKTAVAPSLQNRFEVVGLLREHWSSAAPIREIFKTAFSNAGRPNFNPHSFRDTLTKLGQKLCKTPEEFKAWSQNMGHEGVMTTFRSYGDVDIDRQREIFASFSSPRTAVPSDLEGLAAALAVKMRELDARRTTHRE